MLHLQDYPDENLLEISINGTVSQDDYAQFQPLLEQKTSRFGKVNLLVDVRHMGLVTPPAVWEDLKLDVKYWSGFGRIAVISDNSTFLDGLTAVFDKINPADIRNFNPEQQIEARSWARAGETVV